MQTKKSSFRKEGNRIRNIDSLHFAMVNLFKKRCDSEVYFSQCFDLGPINAYIQKKNAENSVYHYSLFQVITAIACKVLVLRPQMNRYIQRGEFYGHNGITVAFVAKKIFSDTGEEKMVKIKPSSKDNMDTVHQMIYEHISSARNDKSMKENAENAIDTLTKMPHFISRLVFNFLHILNKFGLVPYSIRKGDCNFSSCLLANLGSIHLPCGYHHLNEWGSCSMMCVIGEKKKVTRLELDGSKTVHEEVEIGLTLDERIADGYYFSKTLCLIRKLFENPELLDLPFDSDIDY